MSLSEVFPSPKRAMQWTVASSTASSAGSGAPGSRLASNGSGMISASVAGVTDAKLAAHLCIRASRARAHRRGDSLRSGDGRVGRHHDNGAMPRSGAGGRTMPTWIPGTIRTVALTVCAALAGMVIAVIPLSPAPAHAAESVTYTYRIAVKGALRSDVDEFAIHAAGTLADARGWSLGGSIRFVQVASGGDFTLWLAEAG